MAIRRMTLAFPITSYPVSLTYKNGVPTFKQGPIYGASFLLSFGEDDFKDAYHGLVEWGYRIRMTATGKYMLTNFIYEPFPESYPARRKVEVARFREQSHKIFELAQKIDDAMKKGEEFDFSEYLTLWERFDEDFFIWVISKKSPDCSMPSQHFSDNQVEPRAVVIGKWLYKVTSGYYRWSNPRNQISDITIESVAKIPSSLKMGVTKNLYPPNSVYLTYRHGKPIFWKGKDYGIHLDFNFGGSLYDMSNRPTVIFSYVLTPADEGEYEVVKEDIFVEKFSNSEGKRFLEQKPNVEKLMGEVNIALQHKQTFNFSEYLGYWERFDEDFFITISQRNKD